MATEDVTQVQHIVRTPGVVGGRPRIAGTRIRVQDVYVWHELQGMSADEIASEYDITLGDVYAALAYYFDHVAEMEEDRRREAEVIADAIRRHPPRPHDNDG